MELLRNKLRRSDTSGIFHDSRGDIRVLIDSFNIMHDKINELIIENKVLKEKLQILEKEFRESKKTNNIHVKHMS